jgi:hypothetical protein
MLTTDVADGLEWRRRSRRRPAVHHGFAIERKRPARSRTAGTTIAGAARSVVAASANGLALAADLEAVAIVLDLVNPVRPGRWPRGAGGMQGETNPLATVFGRSMRQFYRLAHSGGNREIAAMMRGSDQMKSLWPALTSQSSR